MFLSDRISCRTEFLVSRVGVRVLQLKWNHPWFLLLLIIAVSSPPRRIESLNSVQVNGAWRRFLKLTLDFLLTSSFYFIAFQSITGFSINVVLNLIDRFVNSSRTAE